MEVIVLFTIASAFVGIILILILLKRRVVKDEVQDAVEIPQRRPIPRTGVAQARNARARMRAGAHQDSDDEDEGEPLNIEFPDGKIGTKKRAKLEAKAERKAQREVEEKGRLDKKKRLEQEEEERQRASVKDHQEEERRLEEERQVLEEKERQEHEEYLKMKAMFSVEEEGYEEGEGEGSETNLLQQFVSYIKDMKVVVLEDLAAHFKLKTQNVIDRIQTLQTEGLLTGVVDDRGKFIYVSQEELEAVARFVKQRGRVSIVDLAESSNQLVNLNSTLNQSAAVN